MGKYVVIRPVLGNINAFAFIGVPLNDQLNRTQGEERDRR